MGAVSLSQRDNWQMGANRTGLKAEKRFSSRIAEVLPAHYEVTHKPEKIVVYSDGKGIQPDTKITNRETGKCLFIEKKAGNRGGNATEERATKYLSRGLKRKVKEQFDTPDEPFFTVFSGDIFNGRDGKLTPFVVESKSGKQKVIPRLYREKVHTFFEGENYAIMDADFSNIHEVAKQIMDIV
jgi:hypothetical protein